MGKYDRYILAYQKLLRQEQTASTDKAKADVKRRKDFCRQMLRKEMRDARL